MARVSSIVDHRGRPMRAAASAAGWPQSAYTAASTTDVSVDQWLPRLESADSANSIERERIAARVHDLARNDGWASSGVQKLVDAAIGGGWRLSSKPDWFALRQTKEWAVEFAERVESLWRGHANDPRRYIDLERKLDFAGLLALKFRHRVTDGESLSVMRWRERGGMFATCEQVIDPDRLSNPNWRSDTEFLRGGVELDSDGAAIAYHIRSAHPGEMWRGASAARWDAVERETSWGRPIVIHDFEPSRAGETRPVSPLAPVLAKFRMLGRYDVAELQAAILNAVLAAFLETPFSAEEVLESMNLDKLGDYQTLRAETHKATGMRLDGVRLNMLAPGEKVVMPQAIRPAVSFAAFETACLRNIAGAMGLSYEQLAMDWSKTNYSSARAALVEVWRFIVARRSRFAAGAVMPHYMAWMEEAFERGYLEAPPGAPAFEELPFAYLDCKWIGPPRGWVDPVKEAQGAQLRMEAGFSTLEHENAEQGLDWEETLEQRKRELAVMKELGLPIPEWGQAVPLQSGGDETETRERESEATQ
ncbi:phage portal protein [Parvibaculum sp.]|uniref:phage portal protein n=1 Tax=Parvibaculum sp. TaxID=2024848 RepID=UPI00260CA226|nr:phage portal protein [Parvibaculum sp.]MCW5727241.1 phage portal protein [Parvibaculum sp.]